LVFQILLKIVRNNTCVTRDSAILSKARPRAVGQLPRMPAQLAGNLLCGFHQPLDVVLLEFFAKAKAGE